MRVKITKCSNWMFWYHNQIHDVYRVLRIDNGEYIVRADDGFLNIIKPEDCEIIMEDSDAI